MKTLLVEGFVETCRNLGAALRLFWPLAVLLALNIALSISIGPVKFTAEYGSAPLVAILLLVGALALFIYLLLMLCQGAVGWHRKLLLNEDARWAPLGPSRRSLKYAVPVVTFVLIMLVGFFLALQMIGPHGVQRINAAYEELKMTGSPTMEQLEALRQAMIPLTLINFIATVAVVSAVLWFGQSWLLVFPHIAVRSSQPGWGKINDRVMPYPRLVGALLLAYFLPAILVLVYGIAVPIGAQLNPAVQSTSQLVNLAVSILCFLWGLSILSIAYRTVVADKVPYMEAGNAAPAQH